MKTKSLNQLDQEYLDKYGHIPMEEENIFEYIKNKYHPDMDKVAEEVNRIDALPWKTLDIVIPIIPRPSPRPRYSSVSNCFYVSGAAQNKKLFQRYLEERSIIYTKTHFFLETYQPTPVSQMTKEEIILAEMKKIGVVHNPDWDNLGKTYSDMIQDLLILNDNIITIGDVQKYYSVKPRVVIKMAYQCGFDSKYNRKKITKSTSFIKAVELGKVTELYE